MISVSSARAAAASAPMAPSDTVWKALSPAERVALLARLGPIPAHEALPPEGDAHIDAWLDANDALKNWFRAKRRRAYIGRGITVYYPEEPRFAPDLFVVLDAEPGTRSSWVVSAEGRGLDFALEVYVSGDKKKDAVENVERYARLGISEYFLFDAGRCSIAGHRLEPGSQRYVPIVPQMGRWESQVLGLTVGIRERRLRFFDELHVIPFEAELNEELRKALSEAEARAEASLAEAESSRVEAEARAATEAARADALEAELARMRALLVEPPTS